MIESAFVKKYIFFFLNIYTIHKSGIMSVFFSLFLDLDFAQCRKWLFQCINNNITSAFLILIS